MLRRPLPARHPRRRPPATWWSWLCVLALAFQTLLLPLVHRPPQPIAAGGLPAWVMASLCRAVPEPDEPDRRPIPGKACPICLSVQIAATLLSPPPVAVSLPRPAAVVAFPTRDTARIATTGIFRPQARDPPLPT